MATVTGVRQLEARLRAIGEPRPLLRALQIATIAEAQKRVPRKTGHLQRSIQPGAISDDSAIVAARTPYAAAVEFGSKPHRIPKTGNAKRPMPIGGARRLSGRRSTARGAAKPVAFAWNVQHPGTKPHPYLVPAAKWAVESGKLKGIIIGQWNGAA